MQQELLPLFPLQVVLFPRTPIALHIFEERYKEMIGESIEQNAEFGIVLATDKGIMNTGCTAVVDRVVQKYDDGRVDIIAVGRRRFEIQEIDDQRTFLRCSVRFFDDETGSDRAPEDVRRRVIGLYTEIRKQASDSPLLEPELGESQLSFQLAHVISDLTLRQLLLVSRSEPDRMRQLELHFPSLIRENEAAAKVRHSATTNGRGIRPVGI